MHFLVFKNLHKQNILDKQFLDYLFINFSIGIEIHMDDE